MNEQLTLFGDEETLTPIRRTGKNRGEIFTDYESFVAKFKNQPKTTDDCYTPPDVFEAVVKYVGTITDLTDKVILRPFYPGGDYENAEYPDNGIVIDNPPFSIFTKICRFYSAHNVPFFLFGPGLTITSCCPYCTAVVTDTTIKFSNGAIVKIGFATNLLGDTLITTSVLLKDLINNCNSQKISKMGGGTAYNYPPELLSVSDVQSMCCYGNEFSVKRSEAIIVDNLDLHPTQLYGKMFLLSKAKTKAKLEAKAKANVKSQTNKITVPLSPREQKLIDRLSANEN